MSSGQKQKATLLESLGDRVEFDRPLAPLTSLKIGGPARFFFEAQGPGELMKAIQVCRTLGIRYFVLGGGSNILVSDQGFGGLVIKNGSEGFMANGDKIGVQSGFCLNKLVEKTAQMGLSGLEFLAGIPGSVGGAVCGNAGAFGKSIGEALEKAVIFDPETGLKAVDRDYLEFDYRSSKLKRTEEVLISASFRLERGEPQEVQRKVEEILTLRRDKHPQKEGSVGCFFKNIKANGKIIPAGEMLEKVGAKQITVGKAAVFDRHANIIVNKGGAKASEVRELAEFLRARVKERFGYLLEPEIVYVGEEL